MAGHVPILERASDPADGFSLAELIVVLALVGGLTISVAPSILGSWHASTLTAGARELATAINLGRQLAIARRTAVCIDVIETGLRLRLGGCAGSSWTGPVTDESGVIAFSDPATLHVSSKVRVTFTPLGAASPGATYTVTHTRTRTSRAVVVAGSGRISIE